MHTVDVTYSAFRTIDDGRSGRIRAGRLKYILSRGILSIGGCPPLVMLDEVHDMDCDFILGNPFIVFLRCLFVVMFPVILFPISSYCSYHHISSHFIIHIIALHRIVYEMISILLDDQGLVIDYPMLLDDLGFVVGYPMLLDD